MRNNKSISELRDRTCIKRMRAGEERQRESRVEDMRKFRESEKTPEQLEIEMMYKQYLEMLDEPSTPPTEEQIIEVAKNYFEDNKKMWIDGTLNDFVSKGKKLPYEQSYILTKIMCSYDTKLREKTLKASIEEGLLEKLPKEVSLQVSVNVYNEKIGDLEHYHSAQGSHDYEYFIEQYTRCVTEIKICFR